MRLNRLVLAVTLGVFMQGTLWANNITGKAGTTAFSFLKISQGARAAAMADSFVAISDDAHALYWNPAGMSQLTAPEISASHTSWFESISRYYISGVLPTAKMGTFGMGINYLKVADIEKRTRESDNTHEDISTYDMAITLAWSQRFTDQLSLGFGVKSIRQDLDTQTVSGFAADIGALYTFNETLVGGISVQNIGPDVGGSHSDPMPLMVRLGVADRFLQEKLTVAGDYFNSIVDGTASLSAGTEYKLHRYFIPRGGYKLRLTNNNLGALSGVSAGFGFTFNKLRLDYAFAPYEDLGNTHRIDFLMSF